MGLVYEDGPEYKERCARPFVPPTITLKELHDAVPKHLLKKNELKATSYILRDIVLTLALYALAHRITPLSASVLKYIGYGEAESRWAGVVLRGGMWAAYWVVQSFVFAGIFVLGHELGHGSLFESKQANNAVGFMLHAYLLIPFFSWRFTHHAHHKATGSMERDENYLPYPRSKYALPDANTARTVDYEEVFGETPLYTLWRMVMMQGLGWWAYLAVNEMGSPQYPRGTNHFTPSSKLFKKEEGKFILLSDLGIAAMAGVLYYLGREFFLWLYLVPWLLNNNWIIFFTFLHHSDPTIPHYRKGEWTFLRGALCTVDRPLFGWIGVFFFHCISHTHVAHHLFLRAPFFNTFEITEAIKPVLKEYYNYDSTPSFYALWRSFTQCTFVEDEGDVMFYKNNVGVPAVNVLVKGLDSSFESDDESSGSSGEEGGVVEENEKKKEKEKGGKLEFKFVEMEHIQGPGPAGVNDDEF